MLAIALLRHGATRGNAERRYIGSTDEPLSTAGQAALTGIANTLPPCRVVYTSPMLRCLQSADILFPQAPRLIVPALAEYHFGAFEGKNYGELNGDPAYQRFIDSGGTAPIPGAPDLAAYHRECVDAFMDILRREADGNIAVLCHGGAIMAIMQHLQPLDDIYNYRVPNGGGYNLKWRREKETLVCTAPIGKEH